MKGAFLEAGPIDPKFSPLYADQPAGGVPGLDPNDVIEVIGNVYGSNDAPFNWRSTFDREARACGLVRSQFDNCLYYAHPKSTGQLTGIVGAHVDDIITGGHGPEYEQCLSHLKNRFPFRKWRCGNEEFCGVQYNQDPNSFEITYHQKEYAQHMKPILMTRERSRQKTAHASDKEVAALRAVNGAANWLTSQSRPDLAVQASFSQQCFPTPLMSDVAFANQLVHRARQYHDVEIKVRHIPWEDIVLCFHSDAGFGNASESSTQAGYIAAFAHRKLEKNEPSAWSPFCWKSYKLPRKVACALGGEAQAFSTASAVCEWMALMFAEINSGPFDLRTSEQLKGSPTVNDLPTRDKAQKPNIIGMTDCKSLYDNLSSLSSISKCEDKRIAIDIGIVRQSMIRCGLSVHWVPTELMLADALTKDAQDPADLLRSALRLGEYQLNEEASILEQKKKFREERNKRKEQQKALEAKQQEQKSRKAGKQNK